MQPVFSEKFDELYSAAEAHRAEARKFLETLLGTIKHEEASFQQKSFLHEITDILKTQILPFGVSAPPEMRSLRGEMNRADGYIDYVAQTHESKHKAVSEMPFMSFRSQKKYRDFLLEMRDLWDELTKEVREALMATEIGVLFQEAGPYQPFEYKKLFETLDDILRKNKE